MTVVIGIDADARRLAYCVMQGGRFSAVRSMERSNQAGTVHGRYDQHLTALMQRANEIGAVVYLENIFLQNRGQGSVMGFKAMAEVQGEIKREARRFSVPVIPVMAITWHSDVLGFTRNRDALKRAAMEKAVEAVGYRLKAEGRALTQHEADATCIAFYGAGQEEPWRRAE